METFISNKAVRVIKVGIGLALTGIFLLLFFNAVNAKASPQRPTALREYQQADYQRCLAEVKLVAAALSDHGNKFITLSPEDAARLTAKRESLSCNNPFPSTRRK